MNQLVILGNGFDLAHKLKTRYYDFIDWYVGKIIDKLILHNNFDDNLISISKKNQHYYDDIEKPEALKDKLAVIFNPEFITSVKYDFFLKLLFDAVNKNWIDIEATYYAELVKSFNSIKNSSSHNIKKEEELEVNLCFSFLEKEIIQYLTDINKHKPETLQSIEKHIVRDIMKDLEQEPRSNVMFLNFNYTSTIEQYKHLISDSNININYIHGRLDDPDNPIIFGYGDEMDSNYKIMEDWNWNKLLQHFKSFGYFKTNNYKKLLSFIESGNFTVSIMGHSCGLSDRVLLNSIFENKKCHKIRIYYHQKNNLENDYIEKTHEISRHFKSDSKGLMRKKIVPLNESKPLS
jgi:hypothetical protein